MNVLIIFAGGVTVGWAADKLYRRLRSPGNQVNVDVAVVEDGETGGTTGEDGNRSKEKTKPESIAKKKIKADKERRDDLSQLKGVGPKLSKALDELGVYNYEQLSGSSVDTLLEQLRETGGRFTRSVISSIVEGAKQAAEEK